MSRSMHHLRIDIEPRIYSQLTDYELIAKVSFDGNEIGYRQLIPFDFIQSQFDQIWEYAGKQIKEKIIEAE